MKKKTLVALTGAGALASFVVGVTPRLKGAPASPEPNKIAYLGSDSAAGLQKLKNKDDKDDKDDKKVKKPKKVKSPKKFKA